MNPGMTVERVHSLSGNIGRAFREAMKSALFACLGPFRRRGGTNGHESLGARQPSCKIMCRGGGCGALQSASEWVVAEAPWHEAAGVLRHCMFICVVVLPSTDEWDLEPGHLRFTATEPFAGTTVNAAASDTTRPRREGRFQRGVDSAARPRISQWPSPEGPLWCAGLSCFC